MENGNKPINPIVGGVIAHESHFKDESLSGLSKREYFAGLAMQGLMPSWNSNEPHHVVECIKRSIMYADELLKQLENK